MPHYFDTDENETIRIVNGATGTVPAVTIDTTRNRTQGYLAQLKNSGVLQTAVTYMGGIQIGPGARNWWGGEDSSVVVFQYGDDPYVGLSFAAYYNEDGSSDGTGSYLSSDITPDSVVFNLSNTTNGLSKEITMTVYGNNDSETMSIKAMQEGETLYYLRPANQINIAPYFFSTTTRHTAGNLAEFCNSGENPVFKIGISGEIGLKPLTKAQRSGLTPYTGMLMYQSDQGPGLRFYDGTNWIRLSGTID